MHITIYVPIYIYFSNVCTFSFIDTGIHIRLSFSLSPSNPRKVPKKLQNYKVSIKVPKENFICIRQGRKDEIIKSDWR